MDRYRQYRMMKKVKKLLNTPVKEENYTPSKNLYMGNKSSNFEDSVLDPNHRLRMTQVEALARLLLQQIYRLEEMYSFPHDQIDRGTKFEIDKASLEINIKFEELDRGVLLTEAEKAACRLERVKSSPLVRSAQSYARIDFGALSNQIQDWQQEELRRKRRLKRLESSIQELSLNVNDVRCTQILRDRKTSVAALDSTIAQGVKLFRNVFGEIEIASKTVAPSS